MNSYISRSEKTSSYFSNYSLWYANRRDRHWDAFIERSRMLPERWIISCYLEVGVYLPNILNFQLIFKLIYLTENASFTLNFKTLNSFRSKIWEGPQSITYLLLILPFISIANLSFKQWCQIKLVLNKDPHVKPHWSLNGPKETKQFKLCSIKCTLQY